MMQTAQPWHRYNSAIYTRLAHGFTTGRRSLRQREMRPVLVVVADVLIHQAFEMPFIENDHVIDQIAAAIADPTFGDTVLPRTPEAGSLLLDAEALYGIDHFFIELCAAIKDQIARRGVVREGLA